MQRAVFLDRDGTIIEDRGYLKHPSEVFFFEDTIEALRRLSLDFKLFIITSQSGIAKGLTTPQEVQSVNDFVVSKLRNEGIEILEVYVCPHQNDDKCTCKKPSPFFIFQAAEKYQLDLNASFIVGDHPSDVECGLNAGVAPVYVLTGHGEKHLDELGELRKHTWVGQTISDAVNYIRKKA